ncbi:hypothetical protein CMO88_04955 [Candidatus Woesearchaeota archaeon]|nr:hypothetical protein [Candidatus Woesearchaeota archaeon]|tara:strand:+ start:24550 stop:25950 length:1401 start_codon:yes stop_codon:yes gene_type:complete
MKLKSIGLIVFVIAALVFLSVKLSAIGYSASDENTYYKMGEMVSEGKMPYKDFFFAHPPLQIYLYAVVFMLFGFNIGVLKFLSAIAAVVTAYYIFKLLNEKSEAAGMIGTVLFFFSHSVLLFTSFPTGTEFVMMFSMAGFYYFHKKKSVKSGLLFGIGALTGLLALIPFAVISVWLFIRNLNELRKFLTAFLAVFVIVNAFFVIISKGAYITQIITYNLLKPEGVMDKSALISRVIGKNWLILAAAATAVFAKGKFSSRVAVPLFIVIAYAAAFTFMKTIFDYYSLAVVPFLAVLAGQGLAGTMQSFRLKKFFAYPAIAIVILVISYFNYSDFSSNDTYDFETAREIAKFVEENSDKNELIFGEDATTPLISLLSRRDIALDFVDSNDLRFRTGLEDSEKTLTELKENLRFFIVRRLNFGEGVKLTYGLTTLPEFDLFLKEECEVAKKFETPWNGKMKEYYVYDCD